MPKEKRKVLFRRLIAFILLALAILFLVRAKNKSANTTIEILDSSMETSADEYFGSSSCTLYVTLDKKVESGDVSVAFYDEKGKLLTTEEHYLSDDYHGAANTYHAYFYSIDGIVDSYEILSLEATLDGAGLELMLYGIVIFFLAIYFLDTLFGLSCKVYEYNGNEIVVYSGWYHHYLKVNGEKADESNTLSSFVPIYLTTTLEDGTLIEANFSSFNHSISLKINTKLYRPTRI